MLWISIIEIGVIKEDKVSTMIANHLSVEKIMEEINKCDVVCANCHRERTQQRKALKEKLKWQIT